MKLKFKKILLLITIVFVMPFLFPIKLNADMGPKPSIDITFKNLSDEECYATILSKEESTGPHHVWDGNEESIYNDDISREYFIKFHNYEDMDGFYFLQSTWHISETKNIHWGYYPPTVFKILLYYPETDTFVVSDVCERYAFDSYFTVDAKDLNSLTPSEIIANESYPYISEIINLIIRIILTILVEIGIAYIFGYRYKGEYLLIIITNLITQIILNVLLNIINYFDGALALILAYVLLEIVVLLIEMLIYSIFMNKASERKRIFIIHTFYAIVANIASFACGALLWSVLPQIF